MRPVLSEEKPTSHRGDRDSSWRRPPTSATGWGWLPKE